MPGNSALSLPTIMALFTAGLLCVYDLRRGQQERRGAEREKFLLEISTVRAARARRTTFFAGAGFVLAWPQHNWRGRGFPNGKYAATSPSGSTSIAVQV